MVAFGTQVRTIGTLHVIFYIQVKQD